jgi:N-carbamoylputrescine amidase
MDDIRVAAISTRNWVGQPGRAIANMRTWAEKAAAKDAEFILFPELGVSGYFYSTHTLGISEPVPGPSTDKLIALARELGVILCFGLLENDADVVYNTQVIVNGDGVLGKQRKIHMPGYEYLYWRSGFEIEPIEIGKARVGIAICADAMYMELARTLYFKGAEMLIMPFAYGTPGNRATLPQRDIGVMTYRVHCHSNGMYGVVANNAGTRRKSKWDSRRVFPGWAGVFSPSGEVEAWTKQAGNGEAMVVADLEGEKLYNRRRDMYFTPRCLMPNRYATIWDSDQTAAESSGNGHKPDKAKAPRKARSRK